MMMEEEEQAGGATKLADILKLRSDETGAYKKFCERILRGSVSVSIKKDWLEKTALRKLSDVAHVVEESWALLELENNWEVWEEIAKWRSNLPENDNTPVSKMVATKQPKWTVRQSRQSLPDGKVETMIEGWRPEGHNEFLKIIGRVTADRNSEVGKQFEIEFLEAQKERLKGREQNKRKRRKTGGDADEVVVVPSIDFLDELIGDAQCNSMSV